MNRKNLLALLFGFVLLLAAFASAAAQMNGGEHTASQSPAAPSGTWGYLTYQGRLTDSSGAPISSSVSVVFKLYDESSTLKWTSATRSITPNVNGLFTVYLGGGSDPNLSTDILSQAASIGVTVGSDSEMTPRQPLYTVVGHSVGGSGVVGSSVNSYGMHASSTTSYGMLAETGSSSYAALVANNTNVAGPALEINRGSFVVTGAGVGSQTPVFIHKVVTTGSSANICKAAGHSYVTIIDNPIINGNPDAILIVTPNYGTHSGGTAPPRNPVGVFYDDDNLCLFGAGHWGIYDLSVAPPALVDGQLFDVMVIVP